MQGWARLIKKVIHKGNIQELTHICDAFCISYYELEVLEGRKPMRSPKIYRWLQRDGRSALAIPYLLAYL
jgi:hypothetical protein